MAIRLGITGGIGSGKSVVSKLLELMGVPMYISDDEAKRLMNQDEHIRQQLEQWFGPSVYENGTLNRSLLARSIFGHPERMAQVNGMVHPVVKRDFQQWVASHSDRPLVGMESAILIEAGFQSSVDCVVMVYAPLEVRLQRVLVRDAATEEQVKKRMAAQMSDENKREQADFVIVNDGRTPLIPQVLKLISLLSKNNHYLCAP